MLAVLGRVVAPVLVAPVGGPAAEGAPLARVAALFKAAPGVGAATATTEAGAGPAAALVAPMAELRVAVALEARLAERAPLARSRMAAAVRVVAVQAGLQHPPAVQVVPAG